MEPHISTRVAKIVVTLFAIVINVRTCLAVPNSNSTLCSELLMGQYKCNTPEIDTNTQQALGCRETRTVDVVCVTAPNLMCRRDSKSSTGYSSFYKAVPCSWTNGHHFETSLLLSIFLGMFGMDRFYLGYPAIGLLKFSTLGFFFLGQLIDVLLIATQAVGPSDGSDYIIDYYGAGLRKLAMNNETFIKSDYYT